MPEKEKEQKELFPVATASQPLVITDPAAIAAAEAVKARIQSLYVMAHYHPRDPNGARQNILHACKRTGFAEKVEFSKPVGGKQIKGPSVRFAETALKEWGNVLTESQILHEDEKVRRSKVFCTDLEKNVTYSRDISVSKTVERRNPTDDREVLGERKNTKGETVYIVRATEDEMQNKESALISKAFRNEGLRLIPTDIIDEAIEQARETLKERDRKDPDAAKKQMLDAFGDIGVRPKDIEAYLGHSLEQLVPAELQTLRGMFRAIRDGEATWKEYLEKGEEPEKEAVDEAKIVDFDRQASERKADPEILQAFLTRISTDMKISIDQVKAGALTEMTKFWEKYTNWAKAKADAKKQVA